MSKPNQIMVHNAGSRLQFRVALSALWPCVAFMNKNVLLIAATLLGGMTIGSAANEETNQLMIGEEAVTSKLINGNIVGDKWMVVSNELIRVHVEATPIPESSDTTKQRSSARNAPGPSLRLLLSTGVGSTKFGRVKCLHGLLYMAEDMKTPALAGKTEVDIYSSEDNARIALMVSDNGPLYTSTNSGTTWAVINAPGKYEFPLNVDAHGGGFKAAATIYPSPENCALTHLSASNWYAVGSAPDGSGLVLTKNPSQSAPALNIMRLNSGVIVSWSSAFTGFVLQSNEDLSSTNWADVPNQVKTVGLENQVIVPSPASNAFYRLRSK